MSFLRKSVLITGGQLCATVLGMAGGILYSRTLGPDGMGQFELLRHTAIVTLTFFSVGLGNANIFFLNNRGVSATAVASNTIKMAAALGLMAATALLGMLRLFPEYFGKLTFGVALCLALGVGLSVEMWALRGILIARVAARWLVAHDLLNPFVLLAAGGALAWRGCLDSGAALIVLSVAFCAGLSVVLLYLRGEIDVRRRFDWELCRGVLGYGVKLAAANLLLVVVGSVAVMQLRYMCPEQFAEVGLFTRAVAVCALVRLTPQALSPLLYAKWSGVQGATRARQAELAARMSTTFGVAAALVLLLLRKYMLWLLYGKSFIPAQGALAVLAVGLAFITISDICYNLLAGDGRALVSTYVLTAQLALTCGVTYAMVSRWGIVGAAAGVCCGNFFSALVGLWVCRNLYGIDPWRCLFMRRSDFAYVRAALRR